MRTVNSEPKVPHSTAPDAPPREPIFNLPAGVTVFALVLIAIHAAYEFVLGADGQWALAIWFGYLPIRLTETASVPGGFLPMLWSPLTHALLHGSWAHLFLNVAWFAIFATPTAHRYGTVRMLVAFFVGAVAGALAFTALQWGQLHVLIGASGGVAGLTGLAMRFVFQPVEVARHPETGQVVMLGRRLSTLPEVFGNRRSRIFTFFWVGINLAVPIYERIDGAEGSLIAWQAHIGGFVAGLLLAPLLEKRQPPPQPAE